MPNCRRRDVLGLVVAYLMTRALLHSAGFQYNLDLRWMFLADPSELKANLAETLLYFHAFPPGMNLLAAALLALPSGLLYGGAVAVSWVFGALLTVSLAQMLQWVGGGRWPALVLSLAFSLLPQSLYFEGLFLYTFPCAALLCAGGVFFCRAVQRGCAWDWFFFFLVCALLGWVRTTFHLVWFLAMVGFGVLVSERATRRRVLVASAVPFLILTALYLKNWALFGVFGTTSWSGANLTLTTTARMTRVEREFWIRSGRLSPFARLSVFAPPKSYLPLLAPDHNRYPWPGGEQLWRPEARQPNFNHGLFIEVNHQRRRDAMAFIQARPWKYATTVLTGNLPAFFSSSTRWHPHHSRPGSPHAQHRSLLGGYESGYERLVHSFPTKGVGLYWLLPVVWVFAGYVGLQSWKKGDRAKGALIGFCLLQVFYVTAVSVLLTAQESSRYRYLVEPCIATLCLVSVSSLWTRFSVGLFSDVSQ